MWTRFPWLEYLPTRRDCRGWGGEGRTSPPIPLARPLCSSSTGHPWPGRAQAIVWNTWPQARGFCWTQTGCGALYRHLPWDKYWLRSTGQGADSADTPWFRRWGEEVFGGAARSRGNPTVILALGSSYCAGKEVRWLCALVHRLPKIKWPVCKGCLSFA